MGFSRVLKRNPKVVSRKIEEGFKEVRWSIRIGVSRQFQMYFKVVLRKFQVVIKEFQESFKRCFKECMGYSKEDPRVF